jgi:hypothetical protein
MKLAMKSALLVGAVVALVPTADAARTVHAKSTATKKTAVKETAVKERAVVVVNRGWPIRRALPTVVVRPTSSAVRVQPAKYLAPFVWRPILMPSPPSDLLVWQQGETIYKADDWTEVTWNANTRGSRLFLDVERGKAQISFAEIVFDNGESRVVDFQENTRAQGLVPLLDFKSQRTVDHVRLVTRAKIDPTRIALLMQA